MRIEGEDLPCGLCFVDADAGEIEAARGRRECHDLEEPLERELERAGASGESLIAFALRLTGGPRAVPSRLFPSPSATLRSPSPSR